MLKAVKWIEFPSYVDPRGALTSIENGLHVPFEIKRIFYMHRITADRAGHSHMETDQVVIAIGGKFRMDLSDGTCTQTYELNDPTRGVYVPRMIFIKLYNFSPDAVCLVLANTHYDMSKSIRTWDDYLKVRQA